MKKRCKPLLCTEIFDHEQHPDRLRDLIRAECRTRALEAPDDIAALIDTGLMAYEAQIYTVIVTRLAPDVQSRLDALLIAEPVAEEEEELPLGLIRHDPGPVGVESAMREIAKLRALRAIGLPPDLFQGYPPKLVERLRRRIAAESSFAYSRAPPCHSHDAVGSPRVSAYTGSHRRPGHALDPDCASHRRAGRTPCRVRIYRRPQTRGRENAHPLSHC